MKTKLLIFLIMMSNFIFSQRRIYDPTIVAQEKRQVFESWGDWRPYPKYVLGIQTNFAYSTVWGMLSPRRNRNYKNGADIRPLKVGGIETQRLAEVKIQESESKKIKVEIDSVYKRNVQDFAHWTPEIVDADPLWILYYKRMLKPLKEFQVRPSNYREWGFKDQETYDFLKSMGEIEKLQRKLDLMKGNYMIARTLPMPRGKRFLKYHKCLLEWREFKNIIALYQEESTYLTKWDKIISKKKKIEYNHEDDVKIVLSVISDFKETEEKYLKK